MSHYIEVWAPIRYWEDATVDGYYDRIGDKIPLRDGQVWNPIIRLEDGKVMDWPEGVTAQVGYKVVDEGRYWLLDENYNPVGRWASHYVPDKFLCHPESGFGDYIYLDIGSDGMIDRWTKPLVNMEEWSAPID